MYGSASRLRFPNRNKPAATRVRAVQFAADLLEIGQGYEPVRDEGCDRFPRDAQSVVGLAKQVSGDNQRGPRRFGDGDSIRREVLLRFVLRLTNIKARGP